MKMKEIFKILLLLIALIGVIVLLNKNFKTTETITIEQQPIIEETKIELESFQTIEMTCITKETSWVGKKLTKIKGVNWGPSGKETWYSEKVLPGGGLRIPGRHVAPDGTIRDKDGYIVVASDLNYLPRYSIIETSLGMAKVYDTGCDYGTIDIYVSW